MKKKRHWLIEGLIFGVIMLIFSIVLDIVSNDFAWENLPKQIVIWIIGGLVYGFIMKLVYKRALKKLEHDHRNNN